MLLILFEISTEISNTQVGKECVVLPLLHLMSDDAFACGQYILGNVIAVTIFPDNRISCQNCWHCLENPSGIQGL